jgi:hypothetical protein
VSDSLTTVMVGGEEFRTGLLIPDKIPTTFAEYPAAAVHDLAALKKIYSNPKRKHALDLYKRRKQQGRKGSCAPYATLNCCEAKRVFDYKDDVEYGPEWLYTKVNGGRDAGALLDDCMQEIVKNGCCLRDSVPYEIHTTRGMTMEQLRFAAQQAKEYRALDWYKMPHRSLDACWAATLTAIAERDPVLMAVHCGNGFFSADSQGNARVDRGSGNHAICGVELHGVETAKSLRDIKIWAINSHGARYAKNGCYLHTYDHMAGPVQYHQHCGCRAMRTSPDEKSSTLLAA